MIQVTQQNPVARALRSSFHGETVLAAISGGPDSMAMFHALCELSRECGDLRVIAAHFDHQLREDSHLDRVPVERVAADFGVHVALGHGDVATHARESKQSVEAAARELRYAFLERTADAVNATVIATAHTHSDHIETVLMRILRGTGARGLRGIPAQRGRIVRPLLALTRGETLRYCEAHDVPYVTDPSNTDPRFFRNRIRHDVLPSLRRVYPGIDTALARLSENAAMDYDAAGCAGALVRTESDNVWSLHLSAFAGLDDDGAVRLLTDALDSIGAREDVSRVHYQALLRLAKDSAPGASTDLPGLHVRREHDALVFTRRGPAVSHADECVLAVPGFTQFRDWTLTSERMSGDIARNMIGERHARVALRRGPGASGAKRSGVDERQDPRGRERSVSYVACDAPLTIRFPRTGDRMQPFGMKGHKKLSDLFIDMKIPRRMRVETPVIESNGEILWVVGVATSERCRIHETTADVVRLSAERCMR